MVGMLTFAGESVEFYRFSTVTGRTSSFVGLILLGIIAALMSIWFQNRGLADLVAEQVG